MIKYSIVGYIVLAFLLLFEVNQAILAKKILEKRVEGISTQIKEINAYQEDISNFNANH
jgi:hypothetical protein